MKGAANELLSTKTMDVRRTERGWGGHFICAKRCLFRRNTLLVCNNIEIVVSTVGLMQGIDDEGKIEPIGYERYYETMAFHVRRYDTRYHDADVRRQVYFESPWAINEIDAEDKANDMHEEVCAEISDRLAKGDVL